MLSVTYFCYLLNVVIYKVIVCIFSFVRDNRTASPSGLTSKCYLLLCLEALSCLKIFSNTPFLSVYLSLLIWKMLCKTQHVMITPDTFSVWLLRLFSKHLQYAFEIPKAPSIWIREFSITSSGFVSTSLFWACLNSEEFLKLHAPWQLSVNSAVI